MTSYGDSGAYGDPYAGHGYDGPSPYRPSPSQAGAGRASVPSSSYDSGADYGNQGYGDQGYGDQGYGHPGQGGYGDPGGYGVGSPPPAGRASVPPASGRASVGGAAGRASVPPAAGRASVRPAGPGGYGPGGPGGYGPDDPDDPDRPRRGGRGGDGKGKGGRGGKKKGRLRKTIVISLALFILIAGGGLISFTWVYADIKEPEDLQLNDNTVVYSANNKKIAKLGLYNRINVDMAKIDEKVKWALIAGEDKEFYDHDGISLSGIARAAWNNLVGGSQQGASTITQQYVKIATKKDEITYARKIREAVAARKLEQKYSKEKILSFYVNSAYYGRSSNGWGAAAQAYFGKAADKLTVAEAAVLGAVVKQPEPTFNADGTISETGHRGFDPHYNLDAAKERWGYVLNNMVEAGWLTAEERAAQEYPEVKKYTPGQYAGEQGYQGVGTGNVINYVAQEMKAWGLEDWKTGGYKITTTIDTRAQTALEKQLKRQFTYKDECAVKDTVIKLSLMERDENGNFVPDGKGRGEFKTTDGRSAWCTNVVNKASGDKGTQLEGAPKHVVAAGVAIDPQSGGVLAYYGGLDPTGTDYAGKNSVGTEYEWGGHPGASSFKVYTLAAALEAGISISSKWDPTPFEYNGVKIVNAGRSNDSTGCGTDCTLERMTVLSYNVPFFKVARQIGVEKVLSAASRAGIHSMWRTDGDGKVRHLTEQQYGRESFDYHVAFGQYPITVLDHASGMATFAADGVYRKPHFIAKVEQKDENGEWKVVPNTGHSIKGAKAFKPNIAQEVTGVLKQIPGQHALSGRQSAAKTGTWEAGRTYYNSNKKMYPGKNGHAWFVGYTPQIASAVWVGSAGGKEKPITDRWGGNIGGAGMPGEIWERFMNQAHKDMKLKPESLPDGTRGALGDPNVGDGSPSPEPKEDKKCKPGQWWCTDDDDDDGNDGPGIPGPGDGLLSPGPSSNPRRRPDRLQHPSGARRRGSLHRKQPATT